MVYFQVFRPRHVLTVLLASSIKVLPNQKVIFLFLKYFNQSYSSLNLYPGVYLLKIPSVLLSMVR